ncbi:hypothetical protein C1G86_1378 [Dehalococcoides mccartyi]|uniref:Uncharacterized protein n=1 Tax=Dehalococcoides mccartyi TaxID=61435 RepID=A0A328ENT7_9CHLR|nr:hypothetical protein C1G87_1342 [Dehalococcoides mccartyi]RAL70183.1 hypothetical protein C1G86_1378 [Dehalococcoides mccartyi]
MVVFSDICIRSLSNILVDINSNISYMDVPYRVFYFIFG